MLDTKPDVVYTYINNFERVAMKIQVDEKWLPVYEALASAVRIKIIQLLAVKPMNVKELANELKLSSAIMTMHLRKLEVAGIIKSERTARNGGIQKLCSLVADKLEIEFPGANAQSRRFNEFSVPIGHYTDFDITPTCGIATDQKLIGYYDDPRYFLELDRINAGILWFTKGYIEYRIPNHLLSSQQPTELEISLELGSEAPGVNNNWPSDISFFLNNIKFGQWTSPGDFGGSLGKYTPQWWSLDLAQYGFLKVLRINREGSFVDGNKVSDVSLDKLNITQKQWSFRIAVLEDSENVGGVTVFGAKFGNYNQDILFRLYYE